MDVGRAHVSPPAGVVSSRNASGAVVRLAEESGTLSDASLNALHTAIAAATDPPPRLLVLDLCGCPSPDSRVLALVCDAMRLCSTKGVRLVVRATPALRAWIGVYRIPVLRRVLRVRWPRAAGESPAWPADISPIGGSQE